MQEKDLNEFLVENSLNLPELKDIYSDFAKWLKKEEFPGQYIFNSFTNSEFTFKGKPEEQTVCYGTALLPLEDPADYLGRKDDACVQKDFLSYECKKCGGKEFFFFPHGSLYVEKNGNTLVCLSCGELLSIKH